MFIDALEIGSLSDLNYDVCVVGAGAAGIAIGMELKNETSLRVCILEGGGLEYDPDSQELYDGDIVGRDYEDLDATRLRFFGGSTNHWGGYCMTAPQSTFDRREWIGDIGWPISQADVAPYYERARALLDLPDDAGWTPEFGWNADAMSKHFGDQQFGTQFPGFRENGLMRKPVRMGEDFRDSLRDAENVDIVLNANVLEVMMDSTGEIAQGLRATTHSGVDFKIFGKIVVLATGGLENVRLLLSSNKVWSKGIGNQNDLVGRYFSDHVSVIPGHMEPIDPGIDLAIYQMRPYETDTESLVWHELTAEYQAQEQLVPCSVRLMQNTKKTDTLGRRALRSMLRNLRRGEVDERIGEHALTIAKDIESIGDSTLEYLWYGRLPTVSVDLELSLSPASNRDSRVSLSNERDKFGMRRLELDWRLSEIDFRTVAHTASLFADLAASKGIGRSFVVTDHDEISKLVRWTWHHMCTTRMATNATDGVVDSNCRIFGTKNLYCAGSSVFTTSGWCTPTFLIVALAQRLADHVKSELST